MNLIGKTKTIAKMARQLARAAAFRIMERLLPVDRRLWVFCSWAGTFPHTQDNPRAVFEEVKDDPTIKKVVLLKSPTMPDAAVAGDGVDVHFVPAESLRGAYYLARAYIVAIGYAIGVMTSYSKHLTTKHRIAQLWHGIPLKRIGRLFPEERWWDAETPLYAAAVCSSERDQELMAGAFAPLSKDRVWLTGLPRNDLILKPEDRLPADYRRQLDDVRRRLDGRRLVLYAPTWRQHGVGIYEFTDEEQAALTALLRRHGAVFGIRGHANRRGGAERAMPESFMFLNDIPDANLLLRITDVLVTDYSSIYIDYLLRDRPVLHFAYDLEAYVQERGFLYDTDEAFAGPALRSVSEVLDHLDGALAGAPLDPGHSRARRLFHTHPGNSAGAVAARMRTL